VKEKMDELKALALRIKQTREKLDLSQEEFGKKLDCCKSSIINYESGRRVPGAPFLIDIVNCFGISPDWLLMGRGDMAGSFPYFTAHNKKDEELHDMLEHLHIPSMKRAIIAEYQRLKNTFKPLIDEFDQSREYQKRRTVNER